MIELLHHAGKGGKRCRYTRKRQKPCIKAKKPTFKSTCRLLPKRGEVKQIGDPFVADASITKVDRNGFEITYLAYLFDVFDQLGGQKYKVFKYIVENKSSDNTLIITTRELAERCKVSTKTVNEALKLLRDKGLIATRTGAIMLLPKIAHRGRKGREQYLMHKFQEFGTDTSGE